VASPLLDPAKILARLDAVEALNADLLTRTELKRELTSVYDLPRIVSRVSTGVAGPRDLKALRESLVQLPAIRGMVGALVKKQNAGRLEPVFALLDPCTDIAADLTAVLAENPPMRPSEGGVIREGFDA